MKFFYKSFSTRGIALLFFIQLLFTSCYAEGDRTDPSIITGAEQLDSYLPLLRGKKVGLIVNQTSVVGSSHLVDTLLSKGINIVKVFAPEHGFRGQADAGETIKTAVDQKTGLPIVSLYGSNKKPSTEQLADIDILVFDIQDVGTRFYTYISTMHYAMEACAENAKKFLVLDRPNPNGNYIDGPVLEPDFKSFVGMHPIPVVHGLTVGELAMMINGEKWLKNGISCDLTVIEVSNYTHETPYALPIKPSPNLPNQQSILLYPSLCFFEGTVISIGRGTEFPFQVIGYPDPKFGPFEFVPKSTEGAKNPRHKDKICYGQDLRDISITPGIDLGYLIDFYNKSGLKDAFFIDYFNLLAGTDKLQKQIIEGKSEKSIKESWQPALEKFKREREKYLLYPDFK